MPANTTFTPGLWLRHASSTVSWLRQLISRSVYGIAHAVDVADLSRQAEDDIAIAHQVVHRRLLADVGDVDLHAIGDAVDVEQVAAVIGDQGIDEQHVGAEIDERARQVAADEPEAAGDHHGAAAVELAVVAGHLCVELRIGGIAGVGGGERPDTRAQVPRLITSSYQRRSTSTRGLGDPAEVEELRFAEGAVIVMHRHLDDAEAGVLDLLHHLEADDAAAFLEVDLLEDRPAHQPEVAVHIADAQAEQEADEMVVDPADDDAVQRIRTADLVAVDQIRCRRHPGPEHGQLRRVVLRVAVGVEDNSLVADRNPVCNAPP